MTSSTISHIVLDKLVEFRSRVRNFALEKNNNGEYLEEILKEIDEWLDAFALVFPSRSI
jgi:hypothetical protein